MNHIAKADGLCGDAKRFAAQIENPRFQLSLYIDGLEPAASLRLLEHEIEGRIRGYVYEGFHVSIMMDGSTIEIVIREPTEDGAISVSSALPQVEIDKIIGVVRNETSEVIVALEDHGNGVIVKTGILHGYHWKLRKGRTEWKIIHVCNGAPNSIAKFSLIFCFPAAISTPFFRISQILARSA
jgi:hypothetical protein